MPTHLDTQDKRKFLSDVQNFYWDGPYLFKYYPNQIYQRCILDNEVSSVMKFCHSKACGGHFSSRCKNLTKWILLAHHVQGLTCILQYLWKLSKVGIYFKTSHDAFKSYSCHWDLWLLGYRFHESISSIIWFLVHISRSRFVSKWIEAIPSRNNDHKTVIKFLKENILSRFRIPRAMISDGGTHFCNKSF